MVFGLYGIMHYRNRALARTNGELARQVQVWTQKAESLNTRLAPFEAIAAKSFPNEADRQRLDLLIQSIEDLNRKYGSFELRRADALELNRQLRDFKEQYAKTYTNAPKVHLFLYAAASDASRRLFEQMRFSLKEAGWEIEALADPMQHPIERGIWLYTKNPRQPPEQQVFWTRILVQFGLNLKIAWYGGALDERSVVLVINDPSYIR